ncbi:uncharacterized protein YecT (DUF1311 family) [Paraburkholderia sp. GAS448]|uniref:lysozyme inhibitor LprI family protein n=1 Tax=Paraburkholderia sp. GAS448 TaxID=3035136 RepID=UPI003D1E7F8C
MRVTSILFALLFVANAVYASSSIYGSAFDYKKAEPSNVYFSGKTRAQIASYCKNERLNTMDLSACAHFQYENTISDLNARVLLIEKTLKEDDKENGAYGEPAALPFFKRAQMNWELYRDNDCYSDVYSVGQASLRFVDFWDCMTRITKNRLDELTKPNNDE